MCIAPDTWESKRQVLLTQQQEWDSAGDGSELYRKPVGKRIGEGPGTSALLLAWEAAIREYPGECSKIRATRPAECLPERLTKEQLGPCGKPRVAAPKETTGWRQGPTRAYPGNMTVTLTNALWQGAPRNGPPGGIPSSTGCTVTRGKQACSSIAKTCAVG